VETLGPWEVCDDIVVSVAMDVMRSLAWEGSGGRDIGALDVGWGDETLRVDSGSDLRDWTVERGVGNRDGMGFVGEMIGFVARGNDAEYCAGGDAVGTRLVDGNKGAVGLRASDGLNFAGEIGIRDCKLEGFP